MVALVDLTAKQRSHPVRMKLVEEKLVVPVVNMLLEQSVQELELRMDIVPEGVVLVLAYVVIRYL